VILRKIDIREEYCTNRGRPRIIGKLIQFTVNDQIREDIPIIATYQSDGVDTNSPPDEIVPYRPGIKHKAGGL